MNMNVSFVCFYTRVLLKRTCDVCTYVKYVFRHVCMAQC